MLLLEKIALKNACQHADLTLYITQGLSAIVGPNGAGKSSILRLVSYGLTGLVDGTWGTQSNLQKDGQLTPGYVQLTLVDQQSSYVIRRYFTDNAKLPDTITKDGATVATKRAAVDKYMQELIGIPKSVMLQLVWARQEALDWLLTSTAAGIDDFLLQVFDLTKLKSLRTHIQAASNMIYDLPIKHSEQYFATANQEVNKLAEQLQLKKQQLEKAQQQHQAAVDNVNALLAGAKDKIAPALHAQMLQSALKSCSVLQSRMANAQSKAQAALFMTEQQLTQAQRDYALFQSLHRRLNKYRQWLDKVQKRLMNSRYSSKLALDAVQQAGQQLRVYDSIVQQQSHQVCRYCGSVVTSHAAYLKAQLTQAFPKVQYKTSYTQIKQVLHRRYDIATQHAANVTDYVSKIQQLQQHIQAKCQAVQDSAQRLLPSIDLLNKYHQCQQALHTIEQLQPLLQQSRAQVQQWRQRQVLTDHQQKQIRQAQTEEQRLRSGASQLQGQLTIMQWKLQRQQQTLRTDIEQYQQANINKCVKQVLAQIRSCFGAQRAQARFLAARIQSLNSMLRQYCTQSDLPFVLFMDTQQHVFKYTVDQYEHPAGHLSGAQKKIAAMILQICLLGIVQPSLGLQMLDEVDASLDPANRIMLSQMIARLSGSLRGSMLLVTRQQQTISQCANTIQLV